MIHRVVEVCFLATQAWHCGLHAPGHPTNHSFCCGARTIVLRYMQRPRQPIALDHYYNHHYSHINDNTTVTTTVVIIYTVLIIITMTTMMLIIIIIVILIVASILFVISKQVFSWTPVHSQGLMSLFVGHGQGVFKGRAGGLWIYTQACCDCLLVYFSCSHTYWSIGEDFPTWLNQCRQRTYAWPLAHNGYIGRVTIGQPPTADLPIHAMLDWLSWGHMV